jgi:hypothetical protein
VVYAYQPLTLSLGGPIGDESLSMTGYENYVVLAIGENDSIGLSNSNADWTEIRLQIFDGIAVKTYDLNAIIDDLNAQIAQNSELTALSLNGTLDSYLIDTSTDHAIGGSLAYQYATQGNVNALSQAQILEVLTDPDFGASGQLFATSGDVNDAPQVSTVDPDLQLNEVVDVSTLFSVSDSEGDAITQYEFWDATAGGAAFAIDGMTQGENQSIPVSALQLSDVTVQGGAQPGSDQFHVRAYDGQLWSTWTSLNLGSFQMFGTAGDDVLSGGSRGDALQGLGGDDQLSDSAGNNLLDGGNGSDELTGNGVLIGGQDNDLLDLVAGPNVVALNAGDGQDSLASGSSAGNTLSLGGGIQYADFALTKSGDDLVLETGESDQIILKDWYASGGNKSVTKLQVIAEAMSGYNPAGSDTLLHNKVEQFDFTSLANAFDAAGQVNGWALTNALLSAHLSGSDTEAIGGDLAYQYGKNGTLSGIGLTPAQDVLNAPQFGSGAQTLRPIQDLQQGQIRLS